MRGRIRLCGGCRHSNIFARVSGFRYALHISLGGLYGVALQKTPVPAPPKAP